MKAPEIVSVAQKEVDALCAGNVIAFEKLSWILENRAYPEILNVKKLGDQVLYGRKVAEKVFDFLNQQAKAKNFFAMAFVGYMHITGLGVKKNPKVGLELLQSAMTAKNKLANALVAKFYRNGIPDFKGFKQDLAKAIEYNNKGVAENCPLCLSSLAYMYQEGMGVERSAAKAADLYEKAAQNGSTFALAQLKGRGKSAEFYSPFLCYTPQCLDFIYEVTPQQRPSVSGGLYAVYTSYEIQSIMIKITYTGDIPALRGFVFEQILSENKVNANGIAAQHGLQYVTAGTKLGSLSDEQLTAEINKVCYLVATKAIADVIADFDGLALQRIEKAKLTQSAAPLSRTSQPGVAQVYPGGFFPAQNQPAYNPQLLSPQQLDPGYLLQIMQSLQQNPAFAQQVALLHQQYQMAGAFNTPQPSGPNSNNPFIPPRGPK